MLTVTQAQAKVLEFALQLPPETVALDADALGLVLAEDVAADIDLPPYDKSLMDGFALRSADLPDGHGSLTVVGDIMAGQAPRTPVGAAQAVRIMTGAPMPTGADAVIVVERTRLLEGNRVQIDDQPPLPGQNMLPQGKEMRRGDVVLRTGTVLRPQEFGVLASVGRASAAVYPAAQVAIVATGDELVEPEAIPGPGQIRNSNGPMLMAQSCRAKALPRVLGIARDRLDSLRELVREGLKASILILSGGVSAGKLDLVPGVLQELGVEAHFHKVEMKPGKPVFFGTRGNTLVFGLPGNPVSSLVCFELLVRPAIGRLMGHLDAGPHWVKAILTEDFVYRTDRPTYYPARLESTPSGWVVKPVPWFGSADLRGLLEANAFALLTPGNPEHGAGEVLAVLNVEGN